MRESLLTAEQVANVLGVPRSWVYEQSRAGRIPTVTLGRYRRYRLEAIEAWIAEIEAESVDGGRGYRAADPSNARRSPHFAECLEAPQARGRWARKHFGNGR